MPRAWRRLLIQLTLRSDARLELLGEAASAREALDLLADVTPGLIILDHGIEGDVMGLDAAPLLKAKAPDAIADLLPTVQRLLDLELAH